MRIKQRHVKAGILIALLVGFVIPGSPVGPAVATHESESQRVCVEDKTGAQIMCVIATRDPQPYPDTGWTGDCTVTDARDPGTLTCDDSEGRDESCSWGMDETGCQTDSFGYVESDDYSVTAKGCMSQTVINEEIKAGPVTITVEDPIEDAGVCVEAEVPAPEPISGGDDEHLIIT